VDISVDSMGIRDTRGALAEDFAIRAGAVAAGERTSSRASSPAVRAVAARLDACEDRAHSLASAAGCTEETRRAAAIEFLADGVSALALDGAWEPGAAREAAVAAAAAADVAPGAALLAVFLRAIASNDAGQLPPHAAANLFLWLLVELGPADAASLWRFQSSGRMGCLAAAGEAPGSRRLRLAAKAILDHCTVSSPHVQAISVERWDRPFAALVVRTHSGESARLRVWLREAGAALSPVLERDTLFERHAERERELVSAGERRLVRLGFDLHDGPLQELVALADDLRHARDQVASVLDDPHRSAVRGRFDDLEARLGSLDRGLRDIAHSVRATSAVEQPLEHALRNEVDALGRRGDVEAELAVDGDVASLTDSQKIALFRVVQESLCNIRKHSGATRASVRVRAVAGYVSLEVSDNGCGFSIEAAKSKGRLGLAGVVERVRLLGGDVEIESSPGQGVLVRATLPRWRPAVPSATPVYAATI
jgi:signal transduction histidine kinase